MGPIFVIIFWLLAAGLFGAVWLALLIAFVFGLITRRRWLRWLAFLPLLLWTLFGVGIMGLFGFGIIQSMRPTKVFEQAFEKPPPLEVTNIQSKYWFFADSGTIYLRFNVSPEQLKELIPSDLIPGSLQEIDAYNLSDGPKWWTPPLQDRTTEVYMRVSSHGSGKHFAGEDEFLFDHPGSRTAYYYYLGID